MQVTTSQNTRYFVFPFIMWENMICCVDKDECSNLGSISLTKIQFCSWSSRWQQPHLMNHQCLVILSLWSGSENVELRHVRPMVLVGTAHSAEVNCIALDWELFLYLADPHSYKWGGQNNRKTCQCNAVQYNSAA